MLRYADGRTGLEGVEAVGVDAPPGDALGVAWGSLGAKCPESAAVSCTTNDGSMPLYGAIDDVRHLGGSSRSCFGRFGPCRVAYFASPQTMLWHLKCMRVNTELRNPRH